MSNDKTEVLPTTAAAATAAATATAAVPVPVRRSILRAAASVPAPAAQPERSPFAGPFAGRRDATPTELLPAVSSDAGRPANGVRRSRRPHVSTPAKPTGSREARRERPTGTKGLRRRHPRLARHLRAALAGLLIAAAILIPMQLFASQGISSARQAALAARPGQASPTASQAAPMSGQSAHSEQGATSPMSGQSDPKPDWVTEHTGAAYDRTNPAASPLGLPRCTTSPDTPLPCLATISPSQTRAVVLEEDASLTALVRR